MKTILILALFSVSLYGADITATNTAGEITTKVFERTAKDGKPEMRVVTVYRGNARILMTVSVPDKYGKLATASRSYFLGRDFVMSESDEDADGLFENITLFRPSTDEVEMFTRRPDGSVKPASAEKLAAFRQQMAATAKLVAEPFQKMMSETNMTDEELCRSVEEARRKLQTLVKDKKTEEK